jgi:hypothetical protein
VVLGHVLAASTNPQEVLDAGNWLIQNASLDAKQLNEAAGSLGLSTSMRALLAFPEVVDMMCMKLDWTTELGQAFTADQGAVLDAVQRLRAQAKEVGNLASSEQLKVETVAQETPDAGTREVITVSPPSPQVVYVPAYDPAAVYAPPPATIPAPSSYATTAAAPATAPVATTTTDSSKKYSTGSLVTTGLLAFGAGILVNEIFDDDDDDWDNYYPNYGYGGMYYGGRPYYPPPPYMYRPPYGNGYYPGHSYNRPPGYNNSFNDNTIIINNGGNDYWNRYDGKPGNARREVRSPITAAKPNRPELTALNRDSQTRVEQIKQRPQARPAVAEQRPGNLKDAKQSGYAGARPENRDARDQMLNSRPSSAKEAKAATGKVSGSYAGARPGSTQARDKAAANAKVANERIGASRPDSARDSRPSARPASPAEAKGKPAQRPGNAKPAIQPTARPTQDIDRGRPTTKPAQRPEYKPQAKPAQRPEYKPQARPAAAPAPTNRGGGFSGGGGGGGKADRAAAQRGKASMPKGAQNYGKKKQGKGR